MSKPMLKGVHRRSLGIGNNDQVMAPYGLEAGGDGKPTVVFPGPDTVAVFEDFFVNPLAGVSAMLDTGVVVAAAKGSVLLADTGLAGSHFIPKCTDTGVKGGLQAGTNGVYRITSSATITTATPANRRFWRERGFHRVRSGRVPVGHGWRYWMARRLGHLRFRWRQ